MPRGRPKGSKNKSSSSRSKGTATASQLASLVKARRVRAKQIKWFPALPQGGFKALTTPARVAARTAAYKKFTKKMLSGANKMMPSIAYGSISTAKPRKLRVSSISPTTVVISSVPKKSTKSAFNRASKVSREAMLAALTGTLNYKKPIGPRRRATEKQLAALAKARAASAAKRSGSGSMLRITDAPVNAPVDAIGRFIISR